eukprot:gene12529-12662_t
MAASLCRRPFVGLRAPASTPKACLPYALPSRSFVANGAAANKVSCMPVLPKLVAAAPVRKTLQVGFTLQASKFWLLGGL